MKRVDEWMTPNPIVVPHDLPLFKALKLIETRKVKQLPVVNTKTKKLVGMVTAHALRTKDVMKTFPTLPVTLAMQRNPPTVKPTTRLEEAITVLERQQLSALAVVEDGKLVGILSATDVLPLVNREAALAY